MNDALEAFYHGYDEDGRLGRGRNRLEYVRVQEIVRRFLPAPPASIIDIGGASGAHAEWLAVGGYDVHVVDVVASHIESARERARLLNRPFTASVGDARYLDQADDSYDAALLLGPLYHVLERSERVRVWSEAKRVVRPGQLVFGSMISRWAAPLDLALRPGAEVSQGFIDIAHFHEPTEAVSEARDAGLGVITTLGVEGPGWLVHDFDARWDDDNERRALLELARRTEEAQDITGVHAHVIVVATT